MIVRDEANFISATIDSVRSIADEIVVLDTGSRDGTVATARQLGAVVQEEPWCEDFSAVRNRCLEIVTGDWVLWLDAAERLDPRTAQQLRSFIDQQASPNTAYMIMVESLASDRRSSNEQVARERLMPRRADLRFEGRVRETLRPAVEGAHLSVALAPGRILRHPRQHDSDRRIRRAQRNLDLITLEAADRQGYSPRLLLALGDAYSEAGNAEGARNAYLQTIARSVKGSTAMLEAYYGLLTALNNDQQRHLQLSTCLEALEIYPFDAQLLMAMGNYLRTQGRLDLAVRSFEAAVQRGRVDQETWHLCELGEMAAIYLSLAQQALGNTDQAIAALDKAAAAYPESNRVKRYQVELLVIQRKYEQALKTVDQMTLKDSWLQAIRDAIHGARHFANKEWTEALMKLQGSYAGGFREPFNLRMLALTLLHHGHRAAATPVLREWLELDPDNAEVRGYLGISRPHPTALHSDAGSTGQQRVRVDPQGDSPRPTTTPSASPQVRSGS
jgi:tetratricopeptide (TPR) repeat protein